jgi:hypothetical protein
VLSESGYLDERRVDTLRRNPRVRLLFENPDVLVGEFHCHPNDSRWREENCADVGNLVVFPGTSVVIQHAGREPVVTGPNHLMLYNRDQTYFRRLLDPRGDTSSSSSSRRPCSRTQAAPTASGSRQHMRR